MVDCGTIVGMDTTDDIDNIRYPNITVQLTGEDGNSFFIVARVRAALSANGVSQNERDEFMDEALSGDYDHMLRTVMRWVDTA